MRLRADDFIIAINKPRPITHWEISRVMYPLSCHIICQKLALEHYRLHGILHSLGRVFVRFQEPFYHHSHSRSCAVLILPVDSPVFAQRLRQLLCDSYKLGVLVKVLDRLRLCECVALFACLRYLFGELHQLGDHFLICEHSVEISIQGTLYDL